MAKQDIIDYVMNTPGNTNKMVLEGMLGDTDGVKLPEISEEDEGKVLTVIDGKWDKGVASGDKGYECTSEYTLLTDESVTTAASEGGSNEGNLAYSTPITADTIKVTFNGVEYTCQRLIALVNFSVYGAPPTVEDYDFSEFPFNLSSNSFENNNTLYTETAGTYQVKIEAVEESVETSECFEKAVEKVTDAGTLVIRQDHVEGTPPNLNIIFDKTWQEAKDALASGKRVITFSYGMLGITQQIFLQTETNPFMMKGIKCGDPMAETVTLYACSEDGYLQTAECSSGGGGDAD